MAQTFQAVVMAIKKFKNIKNDKAAMRREEKTIYSINFCFIRWISFFRAFITNVCHVLS